MSDDPIKYSATAGTKNKNRTLLRLGCITIPGLMRPTAVMSEREMAKRIRIFPIML
jgi:hypothetical protein